MMKSLIPLKLYLFHSYLMRIFSEFAIFSRTIYFAEIMDASLEIDDHLHCIYCYRIDCNYNKCFIICCPECSVRLHACKLEDHFLICPKVLVYCPNSTYGCRKRIFRDKIATHLHRCCASVVVCAIQWNRKVVSSYAKRKMKRFAKGLDKFSDRIRIDASEIDICETVRDQEVLLDSYRTSRQDRKRLTDYHNPCHPPLPLRIALQKQETFIDEDSSDDENRAKALQLKKKKSPFENCYICKTDPSSQHLHTLGNYIQSEKDNLDAILPQIQITSIPRFYLERRIFVNIIRERISMFVKKDENLPFVRKGIAVYTFICNDCYRRDEYSNHYKFSHMENDEFIGRCPSFPSGCPFYYHKKKPKWGSLRYNSYTSSVVHCGSEVENVHEEPNATIYSMCEMPFDVLYAIVDYLDSGSLRCLSAVNRQMRKFCFIYFNHLAMVHIKWMKSDTNHWFRKCFVSFTFLYIINHRQRYHHFTNYFMQFQLTGFCQLVRAGHCFG
ncbi:unnamed protein product [Dracunculus medinensis]|uniref:F-box only protein 30 n=1 Tax=Dracunculus medinensis TaxID=318479 RepID=A0A0N4UBZ9_DRAME|nr:unnamed protein product [Dracunculus medinensis]